MVTHFLIVCLLKDGVTLSHETTTCILIRNDGTTTPIDRIVVVVPTLPRFSTSEKTPSYVFDAVDIELNHAMSQERCPNHTICRVPVVCQNGMNVSGSVFLNSQHSTKFPSNRTHVYGMENAWQCQLRRSIKVSVANGNHTISYSSPNA